MKFNFYIVHHPGLYHQAVDGLSRLPEIDIWGPSDGKDKEVYIATYCIVNQKISCMIYIQWRLSYRTSHANAEWVPGKPTNWDLLSTHANIDAILRLSFNHRWKHVNMLKSTYRRFIASYLLDTLIPDESTITYDVNFAGRAWIQTSTFTWRKAILAASIDLLNSINVGCSYFHRVDH